MRIPAFRTGSSLPKRAIIETTVAKLEACVPRWWTGYSYAWFANMKARIHDGEGAARTLRDFAESFCLPNTFHANGDQSGLGKSDYDYRPFTLEGGGLRLCRRREEMPYGDHPDPPAGGFAAADG